MIPTEAIVAELRRRAAAGDPVARAVFTGVGASSRLPAQQGLPSHRVTIGDGSYGTRQTLEAMAKLSLEASRDPQFFDYVRALVQGHANKNYEGEAGTIYDHVVETVRYSLDPMGLELIADPRWTQFVFGNGDCDDHATLVAAMALALGHRAAFRTVAIDCSPIDRDPKTGECPWVHVYALIGIQKGNAVEWHAADTTQPGGYLGWEPVVGVSKVGTWVVPT